MTEVIFAISMSLDGFVTASNVSPEEPRERRPSRTTRAPASRPRSRSPARRCCI